MQHRLSIIIPFWNESRTLPTLLRELADLENKGDFEYIFVDDGSSDNSNEIVSTLAKKNLSRFFLLKKNNGGKTSAVKLGVTQATGTHVLILDADLELKPSDIPRLWDVVLAGKSDVVFGYRSFLSQSSFTWRFTKGNMLLSNLFGLFFNLLITDVMCGFKLMPLDRFRLIPFTSKKFGLEIEIPFYAWLWGLEVYEVDVSYKPRTREQGKTIGVSDAFFIVLLMFRFRVIGTIRKRFS